MPALLGAKSGRAIGGKGRVAVKALGRGNPRVAPHSRDGYWRTVVTLRGLRNDQNGALCRNRTNDKAHARLGETSSASQIDSHVSGLPADLQEVVTAWQSLSEPLKAAVLAIIRTVKDGRGKNFPDTHPPVSGETTSPAEIKEG